MWSIFTAENILSGDSPFRWVPPDFVEHRSVAFANSVFTHPKPQSY